MRRQDVQPGKVYAYREGKYGSYRKAVLLTPALKDTLYTTSRWKRDAGFIRDTHRNSPAQFNGYTPASGWLMAIGPAPEKGSLLEALEHGRQIAEDGIPIDWPSAGYEYKLITSMSYLHGDYDELTKREAEAEAYAKEKRRIQMEKNKQTAEEFVPIRDTLRRQLDGTVNLMSGGHLWELRGGLSGISAPTHLTLDIEAAQELISLLQAKEELIHSLRESYQIIADENDMLRGMPPKDY